MDPEGVRYQELTIFSDNHKAPRDSRLPCPNVYPTAYTMGDADDVGSIALQKDAEPHPASPHSAKVHASTQTDETTDVYFDQQPLQNYHQNRRKSSSASDTSSSRVTRILRSQSPLPQ
jgi:hypothetical protein